MNSKIDPKAFHIAEALINKYSGEMYLENRVPDKEIVKKINADLKKEFIKREIDTDTIVIELQEGYGVAPSKLFIKFGVTNAKRGHNQVTFYEDFHKGK
jgi:hypothetical protein